jgi:hypothetical protein
MRATSVPKCVPTDDGITVTVLDVTYRPVFYLKHTMGNVCTSQETHYVSVRFDVFTAVTLKNGLFWDVTPCGSCKNGRFGGT